MRPFGLFVPERSPQRRPDEMSRVEERDAVLASPVRARSLFTVAAAICFARFVDVPRSFALSLMCSYWRSSLLLQALCGMWNFPPWLVTLGGNTT